MNRLRYIIFLAVFPLVLLPTLLWGQQEAASVHFKNGLRHQRYADYQSAAADFSQAIALAPEKPEYHLERARSYIHLLKITQALDDLRGIGLDNNPRAAFYSGLCLALSGEYGQALEEFRVAESGGVIEASNYYRGLAQYNEGEYAEANENFAKALEGEFPFAAYFLRGRNYTAKGDLDIAISDFSQMIELKPDFAPVYRLRADLYEKIGDKYHARLDHQKAEELEKNQEK